MNKVCRFVVSMGLVLMIGARAQAAPPTPEQAIRPVMAKMLVAANAHDTDAFMAPMVREPSLVFAINGEVIHGWDALHAQQLKWWRKGKSDARYALNGTPEFMALAPDIEVVTWPLVSQRALSDGKVRSSVFVTTYVWQRLSGGWRIVYGHESWAKPPG